MVEVAFRSPAAFRSDICNSITELEQRFTAPLPDRATVFVTGAEALYQLVKGLGTSFDNLTNRVVVPSNGSTDRWVQQEVYGASPWAGTEYLALTLNTTPASQFAWIQLGSTAGSFALASGDATMFAVNPTTGVMTYHGLPRYMQLESECTCLNNGASGSIVVHAAISHNGDVVVGSTSEVRPFGEQGATVSDVSESCISTQRTVFLADGDTLALMLRNMTNTKVIGTDLFTLSVKPL